ncbi:MAG TPA: type II secretion system protein [Gammaproteobacteria bacterium]|nr:type II secretion system protein [Gammaproteobacteria bacterium]
MPASRPRRRAAGFTLIELVAVMAIGAILSTVIWRNLATPLRGFADLNRRAELVATANLAAQRIARELRLALPNSVRVNADGSALEFLQTAGIGRYRAQGDPDDPTRDALDLTRPSDSFEVLGPWPLPPTLRAGAGGAAACMSGDGDCVVIYNTGNPQDCTAQAPGTRTNAWCGDNLAQIAQIDAAAGRLVVDRSDRGTAWPTGSPAQRFYVVDTPVSYLCRGGELLRYAAYPIAAVQAEPPAVDGIPLATRVTGCSFSYEPGSATRAGLVAIRLTVADVNLDGAAEPLTVLEQVHIPNSP